MGFPNGILIRYNYGLQTYITSLIEHASVENIKRLHSEKFVWLNEALRY